MTQTFRVTVLCENSVGPISGTLGEHGFSALVEPSTLPPFLFDTGQGMTLLHNADRMNKNLSTISSVVLSHGHYDHTGGLLPLLKQYGSKTVYAHPFIFKPRYRLKDTGESYPIGMAETRENLEAAGAIFDFSTEFRTIGDGIYLTGSVPRNSSFETGDSGLYCDCNGDEIDQTFDDQSLVLESERGLLLVLGCCHSGIINTIEYVASKLGRHDIYAVIGGTHLGFCDHKQLEQSITELKKYGVRKIAASHCTGFAAAARLFEAMPQQFQPAMVGYSIQV